MIWYPDSSQFQVLQAGWIQTLVERGTLICTSSSTVTLVATEWTRTSALELEPL